MISYPHTYRRGEPFTEIGIYARPNSWFITFIDEDIYSTTYAYVANNALVRTVYEHHLTVGDVILCEWYGSVRVYIYLGEGLLASVDSETQVCTLKENGSEKWVKDGSYYYQRHLLASCFSYQQYAVLRPQK